MPRPIRSPELTRRRFLQAGVGLAGVGMMSVGTDLPAAAATSQPLTAPQTLGDIQHVVIWLQENRSFDHYFGTYPGVRGFADPGARPGVFTQADRLAPGGSVRPFHLNTSVDTPTTQAECLADIAHDWGDQHTAWNSGAMNRWGPAHSGDVDRVYMGYYQRSDLPYFYSLADTFTLCDGYHCSVMGSTTSNRLYAMTGMLDPYGQYGGPVLSTVSLDSALPNGIYSDGWKTYPELLTDAGISWKVYSSPDGDDQYNPLFLFQQYYPQNYASDPTMAARSTELAAGLTPNFPGDFLADLAAGTLPAVSWLVPDLVHSEHPSAAPEDGQNLLSTVVAALNASPLWPRLAMFYTYDENGGFFDHVVPPTAPARTAGEYVGGLPIGLGFRVPCLIVSPFSQGGFVCRDTFDHTSLLRFLETRFGVPVPNLTEWRRQSVGDLTSAFNFARPDFARPVLIPAPPNNPTLEPACAEEEAESEPAYPTPPSQGPPPQEPGSRPSPSGPVPPAGLVPEERYSALALALGAIGAGWLLHRRRVRAARPETEPPSD